MHPFIIYSGLWGIGGAAWLVVGRWRRRDRWRWADWLLLVWGIGFAGALRGLEEGAGVVQMQIGNPPPSFQTDLIWFGLTIGAAGLVTACLIGAALRSWLAAAASLAGTVIMVLGPAAAGESAACGISFFFLSPALVWWPILLLAMPRRGYPEGECQKCGYPVGDLPSGVCPECGFGGPPMRSPAVERHGG